MACSKLKEIEKILSQARDKIAKDLDLINNETFAFCWIIDYPMFEKDEMTNKIQFSHNPFSMPQGEINKINFEKLLLIYLHINMTLFVMVLSYLRELLETIFQN